MASSSATYESRPRLSPGKRLAQLLLARWIFIGVGIAIVVLVGLSVIALLAREPSPEPDAGNPASYTVIPAGEAAGVADPLPFAPDNQLVRELSLALTELAFGTAEAEMEAIFGHPALLSAATGQEGAREESLVFFVNENIHEDAFTTTQPTVWLSVDGSERIEPTAARMTRGDIHHRTFRFDWDVSGLPPVSELVKEQHRLTLYIDPVSAGNTLIWDLPIQFSSSVEAAVDQLSNRFVDSTESANSDSDAMTEISAPPGLSLLDLTDALRKEVGGAEYGGTSEIEVTATFGTDEYFAAAFPTGATAKYMPNGEAVFILSQSTHTHSLPETPPQLLLELDGRTFASDFMERKVSSVHHRVTIYRFPTTPSALDAADQMSLVLPDGSAMDWSLPISYQEANTPFGISWATILALLAGMLASMWPCLFQLTAYFIPALAGMNMQQANGTVAVGQRLKVMKAAFYFVLGFTIVYTAAGAILGFAAGQLGESNVYESAQRWVALGAGIIVLVLAVRVAAKVRAPLVCKMPVVGRMAHKDSGNAKPWEVMLAGLAFATGCMTCFGSAIVIGMVIYVGMAQSALYGALILFLFSLGMGIPLVIAGVAMAKVLPLLTRMERMVKWMGVASATLMAGFGILLISGNYMAFAEFVYSLTGSPLAS